MGKHLTLAWRGRNIRSIKINDDDDDDDDYQNSQPVPSLLCCK